MAAVQLARHLGAGGVRHGEPRQAGRAGRAGPGRRASASSRTRGSRTVPGRDRRGGRGCGAELAGRGVVDASLRLLPRGGRSSRWARPTSATRRRSPPGHPGVTYQAFDLNEPGPDRLGQILAELTGLLARRGAGPLPVRAGTCGGRAEAFRFMSQARHTGKIVLTIPPDPAPAGRDGAGDRRDRGAGRAGGPAPGRGRGGRGSWCWRAGRARARRGRRGWRRAWPERGAAVQVVGV